MKKNVKRYLVFLRLLVQVNEFEVTLERPGAGLSTGSGTVGGARVIPMEEVKDN